MKILMYIQLQNSLITYAGIFILSILIAVVIIPIIIKYSLKYNLVDEPDERKIHKISTPRFGGIAIFFAASILTTVLAISYDNTLMLQLLTMFFMVFILGIIDDKQNLRASLKFIVQLIIATIIVAMGIRIDSLHGLMGIGKLPLVIEYPLNVFIIVGLTNAFNLIDGIDGLAGGLTLINSLIFSYLFFSIGMPLLAIFSISMAGASLGFLFFNFKGAKIFMGDGGSLFIGLSMAVLSIVFIKYMPKEQTYIEMRNISIVFSLMLVPAYDTLRVFSERIILGKSPFHPDKTHIHHLLIKSGFNQTKAVLILYFINIFLVFIATTLSGVMLVYSFVILFLIAGLISEWLNIKIWINSLKKKNSIKGLLLDINKTNQLFIKNQKSLL